MSTIPAPHSPADALSRLLGPSTPANATARPCLVPPPAHECPVDCDECRAEAAEHAATRREIARELSASRVSATACAIVEAGALDDAKVVDGVLVDIERAVPRSLRTPTRELLSGLVTAVRDGRYEAARDALSTWERTSGCVACAYAALQGDVTEGCAACREVRS